MPFLCIESICNDRNFCIVHENCQALRHRMSAVGTINDGRNLYRVRCQVSDLGFLCFLTKYCFVCPILLGQWESGRIGKTAW